VRRALLALPLLLLAFVASSGAQSLPPCGSEQLVADLSIDRDMYATHTYSGEIAFERPEGGAKIYDPVNVQVTSQSGSVRRLRVDGTRARFDLMPASGGDLPLAVTWDQRDLATETTDCSASVTITRTIGNAQPVILWPVRGKTVYGKLGPGYGFSLHLFFATQGSDREAWEKADMTPLRVAARAVKRARRPSRSLPPAAIEFVPGAREVQRSAQGVVQVRRARPQVEPYEADIFVSTRKGRSKRGLTLEVSQGSRLIGSFTLVGSCTTRISYGVTLGACRFKGRQPWLRGTL
jgi:hypothetical protein